MKKQIVIKGLLACIVIVVCVYLFNFLCDVRVYNTLSLQTVYIAASDIQPRTLIKEEDVIEVKIAKDYILNHTIIDKADIVGKYTDIQGKIPAGSPFYEGMLLDAEQLPDRPTTLLKENQAVFIFETDVAKIGSITAGQRVNLQCTISRNQNTPLTGLILQNARVLSIKDHQGVNIDDPDSTKIPYFIELAVQQDDMTYLTMANTIGDITIYTSTSAYDTKAEAQLVTDNDMYVYITSLMGNEQSTDTNDS